MSGEHAEFNFRHRSAPVIGALYRSASGAVNAAARIVAALMLGGLSSSGAALYVSPESASPTPPYATWATAATNIQDAVGTAAAGDEVVVTNGIYPGGVLVTKPLTLRSVNGPKFTVINGCGTNQCVSLFQDASLAGFTLTNGYSYRGGGVACSVTNAYVTNCTLAGNVAESGGAAAACALFNCILTGNSAQYGGAGSGCSLYNCTLSGNSAVWGGGAGNCWLRNCTLTGNRATGNSYHMGGGGAVASGLQNCVLSGNSASGDWSEGGGVLESSLYNCVLTSNSAVYAGGGSSGGYLYNCTVCGNSAELYGGGSSGDFLLNCIVYFNTAQYGANQDPSYLYLYLDNCCTIPLVYGGSGNITNAPFFIDYAGGNLRLQPDSPCINAGNNGYVAGTTDLDGRPRIVGGTVDMGAYESQPGVSGEFIGWLQAHSLPTDGTADYIDSDDDGMNNWQEWVCGTDPTNSFSALKMLSPVGGTSGIDVLWLSVTSRTYFLQRATNLALQDTIFTLATNVPGHAGITTFTDTNAASGGPFFYRVGVRYPRD